MGSRGQDKLEPCPLTAETVPLTLLSVGNAVQATATPLLALRKGEISHSHDLLRGFGSTAPRLAANVASEDFVSWSSHIASTVPVHTVLAGAVQTAVFLVGWQQSL